MANDFAGNPWYIDAVMATPYKNYVYVKNIVWGAANAIGDQLVIKDQNGRIILDVKADAAGASESFHGFQWVNGLQVTTLGSGFVTIGITK